MSGWDGYPQDREKSGLHMVSAIRSSFQPPSEPWKRKLVWWNLASWDVAWQNADIDPDQMAEQWLYDGPVITPAQHAAEVAQARREGAEISAQVAENYSFEARDARVGIAAAIRARGGSDAEG